MVISENEWERFWKTAVVSSLQILSRHLSLGIGEYNGKPQQSSLVSGQRLVPDTSRNTSSAILSTTKMLDKSE
jgi:hypothetical protein